MNQPEVRCRIGTQPNTCSKKCVTPTTLKPLDATSSSDSSARPEPVPSVRTIRSGRCASTMSERSAIFPSTGTSVDEACSAVVNDADDPERDLRRVLGAVGQVVGPAARSDHEHASFRGELPAPGGFPERGQAEDGDRHQRERRQRQLGSQQRQPEVERGDDDQARQGSDRRGDGRAQRERDCAERAPHREDPDSGDERGDGDGRECRGHLREGEHEDRHPDRRCPTDLGRAPRVDPSEQVVEERRQLARRRTDREFPRVMHMSRHVPLSIDPYTQVPRR